MRFSKSSSSTPPTASGNLQGGLQLELFSDEAVPRDAERPLFDLLPEAYDEGYNRAK